MSIALTPRDCEILAFLSKHGVGTLAQLGAQFFPSEEAARKRIKNLVRHGWIDSKSVIKGLGMLKARQALSFNGTECSRRDVAKYRIYQLGKRVSKQSLGFTSITEESMWVHQLRLVHVIHRLQQEFPGAFIKTEVEQEFEVRSFGNKAGLFFPDLLVCWGEKRIAVEVERSRKNDRRYFDRFLHFTRNEEITHVIYYCETDKLLKEVTKQAARFEKIAVSTLLEPGQVFTQRIGLESLQSFLSRTHRRR